MLEEARSSWAEVRRSAPESLAGLRFGLVELSPGGWRLYVVGTAEFDADDETAEWAVGPYAWWPEWRYSHCQRSPTYPSMPLLHRPPRSSNKTGVSNAG
jgi:hypothetical protein